VKYAQHLLGKTQVPGVRIAVRRVTFDDPAEAAAALERWNSSASVMLQLLKRYEEQVQELPAESASTFGLKVPAPSAVFGQDRFHAYRVTPNA